MKMIMVSMGLVAALSVSGCGDGDDAVTGEEAAEFERQVKAEVPYMQRFTEPDDFVQLDESICDSFESGQDYGNVSETVAAYTKLDVTSAEVDQVISVAVSTSCPEHDDKVR